MQGLQYDPKDEDSTAILDAELEGLQTRPHEKEALKSKGHLQYFVTKQNLTHCSGTKTREIKGTKRQQATMEEYEQIEDMIDNEEPVEAVPGRIRKSGGYKKQKITEEDKKKKALEDQQMRDAKLQAMSKSERKEFEAKECYDGFLKELKDYEKKINTALSISHKFSGKVADDDGRLRVSKSV